MKFSAERLRQLITPRRASTGVALIGVFAIGAVVSTLPDPAADPVPDAVRAQAADTLSADTAAAAVGADDVGRPADAPVSHATLEFAPITDGVPRVTKPDAVKALYLNAWAAGSSRKLDRLIDLANRTEINAFVIDVKEGGEISYSSRIPLAREIDADREYIRDIRRVLRKLRENNIYPIARIVVFKDKTLAAARPDWAVRNVDGGEWRDGDGYAWVDSYNKQVWDYNIAIAREALELGFSEIQWDYVRFPDVSQALMRTALWPAQNGRSKADGIREFLLYAREQLAPYEVPVTADVFGLTVSVRNDMGIGQLWEKMSDATDVLLPMVYPSHFARGSYGIAHPNASPRETILRAMQHAVARSRNIANAASIRPWLQDFTLGAPRYTAEHVRAQIDAVYEAGLSEWVLWHPGSNYTEAALASADGVVPKFGAAKDTAVTDTVQVDTMRVDTVKPVRPDTALLRISVPSAVKKTAFVILRD